MTESGLIVIRTYLNRIDAELAQGALGAADIESMIGADDAGGLRPGMWMSGVKLLVRAEDAKRAASILSRAK